MFMKSRFSEREVCVWTFLKCSLDAQRRSPVPGLLSCDCFHAWISALDSLAKAQSENHHRCQQPLLKQSSMDSGLVPSPGAVLIIRPFIARLSLTE